MPAETAADRLQFLNPDEFGATGIYTPIGGIASDPIDGIFVDPSADFHVGSVSVSDAKPSFHCRSDDLPGAASDGDVGDTLAIGSLTFRVVDIQPDGTGFTTLMLGKP